MLRSSRGSLWGWIRCRLRSPVWPLSFGSGSVFLFLFWKGLTWVLLLLYLFRWVLGNGQHIIFWHDFFARRLFSQNSVFDVFDICQQQNCIVAQVWDGREFKLTFRRCVDPEFHPRWNDLMSLINPCSLGSVADRPRRFLKPSGLYSIKWDFCPFWKYLWKIHIPTKFHVFLWLVLHNWILTRDNLSKRQKVEGVTWLYCGEAESTQHMFFLLCCREWAVTWCASKKRLACLTCFE